MKRILASGSALALAGSGAIALAGPLGAQEGDIVEELPPVEVVIDVRGAELSPNPASPGDEVTVTSTDPCDVYDEVPTEEQNLYWGVLNQGDFPGWDAYLEMDETDALPAWETGETPVEEDGSWTVTFQAPPDAGNYEFVGICAFDEELAFQTDTGAVDPPADEAPEEEDDGHEHEHSMSDGVELVSFADTGDFDHKKKGWDWSDKGHGKDKGHDKDKGHGKDKGRKDKKPHKRFKCDWGWKKPKHPKHPDTTVPDTTVPDTTIPDITVPDTTIPDIPDIPDVPVEVPVGVYGPLELVVEGGAAPPAPPITTQPNFTG